jgi:hypothetical protein
MQKVNAFDATRLFVFIVDCIDCAGSHEHYITVIEVIFVGLDSLLEYLDGKSKV